MTEDLKRELRLAAACTSGVAVLLFPASAITLGLGVALGYQYRHGIQTILERRKQH